MKVVTVYSRFFRCGGAENVALQLATQLNEDKPVVLCTTPLDQVAEEYREKACFEHFDLTHVRKYAGPNVVFLSHDRKLSLFLWLYQKLLVRNLHFVHVAHSTFENLRLVSRFPKHIVAVSQAVKANLVEFFHLPQEHIAVIYNGLQDKSLHPFSPEEQRDTIRILLPARICKLKRQVALTHALKDALPSHVHLYFAGAGEDVQELEELQRAIEGHNQIHYLGLIDIHENITRFNYILLFSEKEGLGLSLVEACMYGLPMITNDIPAVLEINKQGETGFVYSHLGQLTEGIKSLPFPGSPDYQRMSRNARQTYEQKFKEETMLSAYREVMRAALGK